MKTAHGAISRSKGFTLIELLIVIAIILILIAIALPNFLDAQARAKVVREETEMRSLGIAIESLRTDFGVLLVDFWDDDSSQILLARFGPPGSPLSPPGGPTFTTCCSWHRHDRRGGTTGLFTPLTTPIPYLREVPRNPFAFERGDLQLIDQDVIAPISYMYHDRESADMRLDRNDWRGVPGTYGPVVVGEHGITKPLSQDAYIIVGYGPDLERDHNRVIPYAPTNGTKSFGDPIYRSDG